MAAILLDVRNERRPSPSGEAGLWTVFRGRGFQFQHLPAIGTNPDKSENSPHEERRGGDTLHRVGLSPRWKQQGHPAIPSQLRTRRYALRIVGLTYRRKVLSERVIILRDKRRPLPGYAHDYCRMLAEYVREVSPITRPSVGG